jgi:hypothetical protein
MEYDRSTLSLSEQISFTNLLLYFRGYHRLLQYIFQVVINPITKDLIIKNNFYWDVHKWLLKNIDDNNNNNIVDNDRNLNQTTVGRK